MGSENRARCSRRFRKSVMVRSVPPRFDRAGLKTRRALVAFLRLSACCRLGKSRFCKISQRDPTVILGVILPRHNGVLLPLGAPLTVLAPYRALLAGRLFLFVCGRTLSFVSRLTGNGNECIASIDQPCLLSRPISRTQLHSKRSVLSHPTTGKTLS